MTPEKEPRRGIEQNVEVPIRLGKCGREMAVAMMMKASVESLVLRSQ
jgi:hypothetical protein